MWNTPVPHRHAPDRPLPRVTYVPGQSARPEPDPFATTDRASARERFLWAVDLFNAGCYWEAHETWEALWHAAGRTGLAADFLKGLIKLAAAGVKLREGRPEGLRRHAQRAAGLFAGALVGGVPADSYDWGLPVAQLAAWARGVARGELLRLPLDVQAKPGEPSPIFAFELHPGDPVF